jgi:hypothetical protein
MKKLENPEQPRFTLMQKSRAFMRGLASGSPLLEVAKEGLSRELGEERHVAYAERIRKSGVASVASEALANGVRTERAECILAAAISDPDMAFGLLINRIPVSESAETVLANNLAAADDGFSCYVLLKLQTVRSHEAQEILAHAVHEGGMSDRAAELLLSSSLGSRGAQIKMAGIVPEDYTTIVRILLKGGVERDAAVELSKRMPPVCVPSE